MKEQLKAVYALEQTIVEAKHDLAKIRKSQLESLVNTKLPVEFISSRVSIEINPQEIKEVKAHASRMSNFSWCRIQTKNYLLSLDLGDIELVRNFDSFIYVRVKDVRLISIDDSIAE